MKILAPAVLPIYFAACLLLGGSTNGVWTNLTLQLGAVAILAATWMAPRRKRASRPVRQIGGLALAVIGMILLQLIPLPPQLWSALPGRGFVTDGFKMIGQQPGWMPLSLEPSSTLVSACFLLPPLAILAWVTNRRQVSMRALVAALLVCGSVGALLGLRQITTGNLALFPYPDSSWGKAPGLFANSSHMALLMLVSLPFLAALTIDLSAGARGRSAAIATGALAIGACELSLIAVNTSAAVLVLTVPVLFFTVALWGGRGVAWLKRLAIPLIVGSIAVGGLLAFVSGRTQSANATSYGTRAAIWTHTREALHAFNPAGTGFGTFPHVYRLFERTDTVADTYINHAHNDYLELALEGGWLAIALIGLFLLWWGRAAWTGWRGAHENVYVRAATVASGAMLLHETVEFPLRSPALAALFALCIGLMASVSSLPARKRAGDLWPARHLIVD